MDKVDFHFRGFAPLYLSVNLAVVGVAQRAVVGNGEETHGIFLERSQRLDILRLIDGEGVNVERPTIALAQDVNGAAVGTKHRAAILASMIGKIHMLAIGGVVEPYIASHARGVMLAPGIFHAFLILVHKEFTVFVKCNLLGWCAQHLGSAATGHRHLVNLGEA